ncbi:hypothetical protein WA026_013619 [Henosepilachna vigintioctopunctata]|uniref:Uncharacterized protein n=1 Tax=Henosepilachna vigintioctopunctata TaxID=420089 RepID=A0AAW1UQK2_9CUCU
MTPQCQHPSINPRRFHSSLRSQFSRRKQTQYGVKQQNSTCNINRRCLTHAGVDLVIRSPSAVSTRHPAISGAFIRSPYNIAPDYPSGNRSLLECRNLDGNPETVEGAEFVIV